MPPLHAIILAGGSGTRLRPLTNKLNKHLLLVHDRPMIYCPLRTAADAGASRVTIVTNQRDIEMMRSVVGSPTHHALETISYVPQGERKGVAAALASAEREAGGAPVLVLLGDNIYAESLRPAAETFASDPSGAHVFLIHRDNTADLAVAEIEDAAVCSIVEKPTPPRPGLAVTGAYLYDSTCFDRIRALNPSPRGELEITALNQSYLSDGQLASSILTGPWSDAGTHEGLAESARIVHHHFPPLAG